jgi:hypothetical protein
MAIANEVISMALQSSIVSQGLLPQLAHFVVSAIHRHGRRHQRISDAQFKAARLIRTAAGAILAKRWWCDSETSIVD